MSDYDIVAERAAGLLAIVLRGFWSLETLLAFQRDTNAMVGTLPCGAGRHRVLVDVTDWPVQSQAVFEALRDYLRTAEPPPERMAVVCGGGLARLQFRRGVDPARGRIVDKVEEGRAWLRG